MNKKFLIIVGLITVILISFYFFRPSDKVVSNNNEEVQVIEVEPADKIEVVHFHGTNQCFSCKTVGEYALKTIQEEFKEEYENGTIIFLDINGELEENTEIVQKYGARGSSLFINAISNDIDNIKEDTKVWTLVYNQDYYIEYLKGELNKLLGK